MVPGGFNGFSWFQDFPHGSRLVFHCFFMVPVRFLWIFMVPSWFVMVFHGSRLFFHGFSWLQAGFDE